MIGRIGSGADWVGRSVGAWSARRNAAVAAEPMAVGGRARRPLVSSKARIRRFGHLTHGEDKDREGGERLERLVDEGVEFHQEAERHQQPEERLVPLPPD